MDTNNSKTPPPTAAAAAAVASQQQEENDDDDATLARKYAVLEQLTQVYGFNLKAAQQAIEAVGANDVEAACSYILDSGLDMDHGGPVVPVDNCPHLELHVKLTASDLDDTWDLATTSCSYSYANTSTQNGMGQPKVDVDDHDTNGTCQATENWFCLECGVLRCSRYVHGHGMMHWQDTKTQEAAAANAAASSSTSFATGHCVATSLADLSVWCYECGAYVTHPSLKSLLDKMEALKFKNETL